MTRQDVIKEIRATFDSGRDICYTIDQLKFPFGFKRMDGLSISLTKLMKPNVTEESLQTVPPMELMKIFETWCMDKGIRFHFDHGKNHYILTKGENYNL